MKITPIEWLLGDDTGTSSETICAVMTGSALDHADVPYDADDFGRCYRLLRSFPEWRARMSEVSAKFPKWGPIVAAWDELTAMYEQLCDVEHGRISRASHAANKDKSSAMFKRISELVDAGRIADGWEMTGPGCWSKKDSQIISVGGVSIRSGKD
ncbi:MAG TPA: hypothetical protein PKZ37_16615 [Gallionellaceae bacterium]|jgi:hypothetical protein|nr:hypothetical protein [Gallionellaceae bacterium]